MRITGGQARGIALKSGKSLRPATDRMREAVFSHLGPIVDGSSFLDLFAGTGSYGLEALSRGARNGCFIEKDRSCVKILQENLERVAKSARQPVDNYRIFSRDVLKWRATEGEFFDLIFADPPYPLLGHKVFLRLLETVQSCLRPIKKARFVFEKPASFDPASEGWEIERLLGSRSKKGYEPTVAVLKIKSN